MLQNGFIGQVRDTAKAAQQIAQRSMIDRDGQLVDGDAETALEGSLFDSQLLLPVVKEETIAQLFLAAALA